MHYFLDWILAILTLMYAGVLIAYRYWFDKLSYFDFKPDQNGPTFTRFSIVVPARNEEANIKKCLDSLLAQSYPTDFFEVIVIDDFSEDNTASIVEAIHQKHSHIKLLKLANYYKADEIRSYKKKAIEKAVSQANGDWIITTDADCIAPVDWLKLYHQYILAHRPVFVAAPVMFIKEKGILNEFQVLDFLALQGITAAAVSAGKHSISNGANLAFEKSAFIAVGGYQGVDHIASGDDMFLMHKMKQTLSNRIGYLFHPNAIVRTKTMPTWNEFMMQRIRWSSKARFYDDTSIFWVLLLVYLYNFSFLIAILMGYYESFLIAIVFKTFFELYFLDPVAKFYFLQKELRYFILYQPIHIVYTLFAGFLGQIRTYTWKGRRVK